ncbi:hypothetical protein ACTWJ8_39935 (plasmid) [Streptomyces sp. SDT5-1]|uniref:hypothetical protein n=1 Tax=Streptomyces sp. SDT5-1 TaxID=3406418 RepID=UPI003FCF5905
MSRHPSAGSLMRITFTGTVQYSYQPGLITLADGTDISFDPNVHTAHVLAEGWSVGDVADTEHGRLTRSVDEQGYEHWRGPKGEVFHDDQVRPDRVVLVSTPRRPRPSTAPLPGLWLRFADRGRALLGALRSGRRTG